MGKMADRRRKKSKKSKSLSKLLELLKEKIIIKAPTPPTGFVHKSKKKYDRKKDKTIIEKALKEDV